MTFSDIFSSGEGAGASFADFSTIAYIRPAGTGYAVCASDGRELAVFESYDAAFFTARQFNLEPVNVH